MILQVLFAIVEWSMQTRHQYMVAVNAVVLQPDDLPKYLMFFRALKSDDSDAFHQSDAFHRVDRIDNNEGNEKFEGI